LASVELDCLAVPLEGRDIIRLNAFQQWSCLVDGHFAVDPTGDQFADEGEEPTAQLVAPAGQVVVMLDQQPAHRGVVSCADGRQRRRPQRSDGDRTGHRSDHSWWTAPTAAPALATPMSLAR
jgi:hypothetical protein